jgi:hypothetical protein
LRRAARLGRLVSNTPEAKAKQSPGCAVDTGVVVGGSLSADLGSEWGESGSAVTAVAPTPDGAGAHQGDEPVASGGAQPRIAAQEGVVAGSRTEAAGIVRAGAMGKPTTARSPRVAGPTEPHDRRADASGDLVTRAEPIRSPYDQHEGQRSQRAHSGMSG